MSVSYLGLGSVMADQVKWNSEVHISEHSDQSFRDYPIADSRCFSSKLSLFLQIYNVLGCFVLWI